MTYHLDLTIPTSTMIEAGNLLLNNVSELSFNVRMFGLTVEKPLEFWVQDYPNQDLLIAHHKKQIGITTAIYLAMQRAKVAL